VLRGQAALARDVDQQGGLAAGEVAQGAGGAVESGEGSVEECHPPTLVGASDYSRAMPALAALAVVTLIHLGAQATAPGGVLADVTQVLLMPLLGWFLVTTTPRPHSLLVRLTVVALVLSWLGDTVPRFVEDGSELGF